MRRALVTGAGSGIGAAVCRQLLAEGHLVSALDRDTRGFSMVARDTADRFQALQCDVSDGTAVRAAVTRAVERWDGLDIVVNAAGVLRRENLETTTPQVWNEVIGINLTGTFHVIQAARATLREQSRGRHRRIVNIGSGAADTGYAYPAYTASKGGVVALTRQLASELAADEITVNAVNPGFVRTAINEDAWADERARAAVEARIPLGRMGVPEEVAAAVCFLASPAASYITGEALRVGGGLGSCHAQLGGAR